MIRQLIVAIAGVFVIGIAFLASGRAQEPISEFKLKDFYVDEEVYPYEWLGRDEKKLGWYLKPVLKLSESEFVYLWKPRFQGSTTRRLSCFNLVLEELWDVEIKLSYQEDVFQLVKSDSHVVVLIHRFDPAIKTHVIRGEVYARKDGSQREQHLLMTLLGSSYQMLGIGFSPDEQQFMLYSCGEGIPRKQVRSVYDYLRSDKSFGYRVTNLARVDFKVFNLQLEALDEGAVTVDLSARSKRYAYDCQLDNAGNVYVSAFGKNTGLEVFQYRKADQQTRSLRYADYPDPWFKQAPYQAHVPPRVGEGMKVYAAHSVREKFRGKWHTRGFRIVTFDFEREAALLSHELEISSAFIVQVNKAREEAGRRPDPVFDKYVIQDILPLGKQGLWLVTQRFEAGRSLQEDNAFAPSHVFANLAEEMVFYEFEPDGTAQKAIIIPMRQQARSIWGEVSRQPHIEVDRKEGCLHLLTREYHGDRTQKPPRIFYRKIDLETGTYGSRMQIYEGSQRDQYFIPPYTVWLNPQLVALMVIDGSGRRNPLVVTLKTEE